MNLETYLQEQLNFVNLSREEAFETLKKMLSKKDFEQCLRICEKKVESPKHGRAFYDFIQRS